MTKPTNNDLNMTPTWRDIESGAWVEMLQEQRRKHEARATWSSKLLRRWVLREHQKAARRTLLMIAAHALLLLLALLGLTTV